MSLMGMGMKYIYMHAISNAAAYGGIADQVEQYVKLQKWFPLTKWDAHQLVRCRICPAS